MTMRFISVSYMFCIKDFIPFGLNSPNRHIKTCYFKIWYKYKINVERVTGFLCSHF